MSIDPLNVLTAIVDEQGRPTREFMQKWMQVRSDAGGSLSTAAQVSAALDLLGAVKGDLLTRGASLWEALGIGASGDVLSSSGSLPVWVSLAAAINLSAALDAQMGSTQGDVIYRDSALWKALAPGSAGQVLATNGAGASPVWEGLSALLDVAFGNTQGEVLYRGASAWGSLSPGAAGQALTSGGAGANPSWAAFSALLDTAFGNTQGDVLYRGASAWAALPPGAAGAALSTGGAGANPLWASLSALLDAAFGSTRGNVLYRGSSAWAALGPGTSGQVLTTRGPSNDPLWAGGGGGGSGGLYNQVMSATPSQSSTGLTTWLNQGATTATNGATGLCLASPGAGNVDRVSGLIVTAPSPPYTLTVLLAVSRLSLGYDGASIGWYDGSSKLHVIAFTQNGYNYIEVSKYTSPTLYSSDDFNSTSTSSLYAPQSPLWLQLRDDGTSVHFRFGYDGVNFLEVFSVAKSAGWLGASGYSNLLFAINPRTVQNYATILSWDIGP